MIVDRDRNPILECLIDHEATESRDTAHGSTSPAVLYSSFKNDNKSTDFAAFCDLQ